MNGSDGTHVGPPVGFPEIEKMDATPDRKEDTKSTTATTVDRPRMTGRSAGSALLLYS